MTFQWKESLVLGCCGVFCLFVWFFKFLFLFSFGWGFLFGWLRFFSVWDLPFGLINFSAISSENTELWFCVLPKEYFPRETVLFLCGSDVEKKIEDVYRESSFWASFCEFFFKVLWDLNASVYLFLVTEVFLHNWSWFLYETHAQTKRWLWWDCEWGETWTEHGTNPAKMDMIHGVLQIKPNQIQFLNVICHAG